MGQALERSHTAAMAAASLAFVLLLALGFDASVRVRQSDEALSQSRALHDRLDELQAALFDIRHSWDAYLLTADPAHLAAHRQASERLDDGLGRITGMLAAHPEQVASHRQLLSLAARQREIAHGVAAAADSAHPGGAPPAQEQFAASAAVVDAFRGVLQRMRVDEEAGLASRQALTRASMARVERLGGGMALLTALLLGVGFVATRRERAFQQRALRGETAAKEAAEERADVEARLAARATAALDDSETRMRAVFESATDAFLVADESQTIVMANPAAARIFRWPLDRLVGAPLESLVPERHRQRHRDEVAAFVDGDVGTRRMGVRPELWGLRADGEEFPVDASISCLKIEGRREYMVILRDVSDRHRAEAARRAQEHQMLGLFNVSSVGMAQADPQTRRFVRVNAALCRITGYSEAELLAMTVDELNHPDDRKADQARYQALRRGAAAYDIEKRYVRKDGEVIWVHASGNVVCDEQGRPELAFAVIEDITQRRAAEQALRASEARLRGLLTELPEPVLAHRDGRITFANRAMQRLLGRPEEALIGHPPGEFVHPEDRPALAERMAALQDAMPGQMVTAPQATRIVRPDGSVSRTESTGTRVASGERSEMLVFVHDVTELRHAQEELARSRDDLRRLVAAQEQVREEERRRIAREIHDELQQTLVAIKIDLGLVAARSRTDPDAAAAMLESADRLASDAVAATRRIVNDLRPRLLDDLGLVPALEVLVRHFGKRHGIACDLQAGDGHGGEFRPSAMVATCLYRVTQEALQNVAKHARARHLHVRLDEPHPGWLRLAVEDDGSGLVEDDLRKPQAFGLLGMRERVLALGGRMDIRANPARGTTIEVELPLAGAPEEPAGVD